MNSLLLISPYKGEALNHFFLVNKVKVSRLISENISQESPITRIILHQGIDIGSGSVKSLIKQIKARIKIVGAQWKEKNVPQILRLRCAYLNNEIKMGSYA